jgi:hypothetical protein
MMFRVLVLQTLYTLSDDQTEYQLRDRFSFMRFAGLALHDAVETLQHGGEHPLQGLRLQCAAMVAEGHHLGRSRRPAGGGGGHGRMWINPWSPVTHGSWGWVTWLKCNWKSARFPGQFRAEINSHPLNNGLTTGERISQREQDCEYAHG